MVETLDKTELYQLILKHTKLHKKLTRNSQTCKDFENGDLVSSAYVNACDLAVKLGRPLVEAEIKKIIYHVGYQKYKEHLPIFRSQYSLEELENLGDMVGFPMDEDSFSEVIGVDLNILKLMESRGINQAIWELNSRN